MSKKTTTDSFKARTIENENGCWIWQGAKRKCKRGTHRYGWVSFRGKQMNAHRAAFLLFRGDIEKGLCVCHRCDVPECVNPNHLFLGTQRENVHDMIEKGRKATATGYKKSTGLPSRAILDFEKVEQIRAHLSSGMTHSKIASMFGVCRSAISNISAGTVWK